MSARVSVVLDDKITRYVKAQEETSRKSPSELVADLLNEWYEAKLRTLHHQYLAGDLTLRGMARQLGLDYRELYDLMQSKGLTV
jgi:hypothetical protein